MQVKFVSSLVFACLGSLAVLSTSVHLAAAEKKSGAPEKISYYKQIRPIFQANCQGCHQPAKAKGGYVMTDFEKLVGKGDTGEACVVAKNPDKSLLYKQIVPVNGEAEMPKGKPPLLETEIELVKRWIAEGAADDTPANAKQQYDMEHPPVYTRPPVITSLDFSPDGKLLAVAGFHEAILHKADGSGIAARLVGLAERIESVRFSPDGKQLAVAGGLPGRMGEVQIWDVEKKKLALSVPLTYDTVYGVSWSPDMSMVAVGCSDNTARVLDTKTGKEILKQTSHNDWVLDTVFSTNGTHLISAGRDMSAKLTEVASARFIDNITSITPGALKGGIHALARHPDKDEILIASADGVPQIYRAFRQTARKIGDNASLIRRFPAMEGRIFSVDYSPDGKMIVAGSSYNGTGAINIYSADFDSTISTNLAKILEKEVSNQKAEEKAEVEKYVTADVKLLASAPLKAGVYAVAFSPDGQTIAAASEDGKIRFLGATNAELKKEFIPVAISKPKKSKFSVADASVPSNYLAPDMAESLPAGAQLTSIEVQPAQVKLNSRNEYVQLIVMGKLDSGDTADITRMATYKLGKKIAAVSENGILMARANGSDKLQISLGEKTALVPIQISGVKDSFEADFIRDVNPVLSKLGCNAGTCHGAKDGKNGFKMSLRGYDPEYDIRALVDDLVARRVNVASPDDSLMLLKATGAVPHEGGQRTKTDEKYYHILRTWIAEGARLDLKSPKVARIEVFPRDPVVQKIGSRQQMRVVATYANGVSRDVTAEAFIETGNGDVATTDAKGLVTVLRRGEAPILARYEGAYAATTVTVMGDRTGFVWQEPPSWNHLDELVAAKWKRMRIQPSGLCTDYEFIRRVYLDLTGLPPSPEEVQKFTSDKRDTKLKREQLVDKLIGNPDFVEHWSSKWADLLQVNRKFLGDEGARAFHEWIRQEVATNTPYNEFVRKILTASGSNKENPAASYYKVLRTPTETLENTTHLFLATRFNCNKCHDHPFERWTQDQYYQTAAYFAQVGLKKDEKASGNRTIGGSAVEGAKPLFEIVEDLPKGEVKHDRTGKVAPPEFPYPAKYEVKNEKPSRREELAAWLTSADNRYFAMSYVNRIWGYLLGTGIIEPLDDIRAGNPPSNPELLDYLTHDFVKHGFDVQHLMRTICKSRTYQLSFAANKWNEDDKINYSHALPRRLPAEVLFDAVFKVTGSTPAIPGVKPGTRAAQLPDAGLDVPSGLLANLGRPPRESACECERSNDIRLGSVMALLSGPTISEAINNPKNELAKLVEAEKDDRKLINNIFLRVLNRPATEKEIKAALHTMSLMEKEYQQVTDSLAEYEKQLAPITEQKEKDRLAAIDKAKQALADYEKVRAAKREEEEAKRKEAIAKAQKALADYEPQLASKLDPWEKKLDSNRLQTAWVALDPKELAPANKATKLTKLKDLSVLASGPQGADNTYRFSVDTDLKNITGVMIEVLPDESLPKFGPGRAPDANFVLTELRVKASPKGKDATAVVPLKLAKAKADFNQNDYNVSNAIDGKDDVGGKGWAIAGTPNGQPHMALFKFEQPVGDGKGTTLRFTLGQRYSQAHAIGRFRVWATTSRNPLAFGLPQNVAKVLKTKPETRTEEQKKELLAYYRTQDEELRKKEQALFAARKPLGEDPKLKELQDTLARVSKPLPPDAKLVQMRIDAKASEAQLVNKRLTGAQDLAWALINNPAFLFNY